MRAPLTVLLLSVLAAGPVAGPAAGQDAAPLSAAYLEEGLPPALDFFREQGFTNFRTATLVDDSLSVYFGLTDWPDGTPDVGWAAVLRADTLTGAGLGFPLEPRERGTVGAEFEVSYDDDLRSLPLHVRLVPDAGLVLWRSPAAGAAAAGAALAPREVAQPFRVGEPMPDLAIRTAGGGEVSLSDLRGQTVVLNWWHTTCSPCVAEIPGLNGLVERYGDRADVAFVAVTDATPEEVAVFHERFPFAYRQGFADSDAGHALFIGGYPEHVVIGPDGIVAFQLKGGSEDAADEIERALVRVIGG